MTSLGCFYNSTNASHHKWKCPGALRSVIFRGAEKEIPFAHIVTNLQTLGVSKKDFLSWVETNC